MLLRVKDFATERGVSESIIYRHIRNHREELGDMVIKKAKATYLTEEGQEYIKSLMMEQPLVVGDPETQAELADLKERYNQKEREWLAVVGELKMIQTQLTSAEETRRLIEEARDEYKARADLKEQELAEANQALGATRQEVNQLRSEKSQQEQELADSRKELDQLRMENERLRSRKWYTVLGDALFKRGV